MKRCRVGRKQVLAPSQPRLTLRRQLASRRTFADKSSRISHRLQLCQTVQHESMGGRLTLHGIVEVRERIDLTHIVGGPTQPSAERLCPITFWNGFLNCLQEALHPLALVPSRKPLFAPEIDKSTYVSGVLRLSCRH